MQTLVRRLPRLQAVTVVLQLTNLFEETYYCPLDDHTTPQDWNAHPFFTMDFGFAGTVHRSMEYTNKLYGLKESACRPGLAVVDEDSPANRVVYKATPSSGPYAVRGLDLKVLSCGSFNLEELEADFEKWLSDARSGGGLLYLYRSDDDRSETSDDSS